MLAQLGYEVKRVGKRVNYLVEGCPIIKKGQAQVLADCLNCEFNEGYTVARVYCNHGQAKGLPFSEDDDEI